MIINLDPRTKVLSEDEETVEVVEVIENVDDYSDIDNDDVITLDELIY